MVLEAEGQERPALPLRTRDTLRPFLKWPGGKRWFVSRYAHILPQSFGRYIEPFLGAGSVFFHLQPKHALLGDLTLDVVNAFRGVQADPQGVKTILEWHQREHSRQHYYRIRDEEDPDTVVEQAARIIYLNRTCFNGIYRVNRQGRFNVPIGTRSNVLFDTDDFEAAARLLSSSTLELSDFEPLVDQAGDGDFVFLDPPYTVRHNNNGFIKYNDKLFSWPDQERLAAAAARAVERGAYVIVTNAAHQSVRELYPPILFDCFDVSRFSSISASSRGRAQYEEVVIRGKKRGA